MGQPSRTAAPGSGDFFWELFRLAQAPMLLLDDQRRCLAANEAVTSLLGAGLLPGRRFDEVGPPALAQGLRTHWELFLRHGSFVGRAKLSGERVVSVEYSAIAHIAPGQHLVVVLLGASTNPYARPSATALRLIPGGSLTRREQDVLWLLADGASNDQIARALGMARPTVQGHISSIRQRLGAVSRAQAVAVALRDGLLHEVHDDERLYINEVVRDERGKVVDSKIHYVNQHALTREPQLAAYLGEPLSAWYPAARSEILPVIEQALASGQKVAFAALKMSDAFGPDWWLIDGEVIPLGSERAVVRYTFPAQAFGGPATDENPAVGR